MSGYLSCVTQSIIGYAELDRVKRRDEVTAKQNSEPVGSLYMVNVDCRDPRTTADFYAAVLGWDVPFREDEYSMVSNGSTSIGFGRVEGYEPPPWPDTDHAKRYHLDFQVDDVAAAEERCVELGAAVPKFQPGGERWRVLTDPEGRPFCLFAGHADGG